MSNVNIHAKLWFPNCFAVYGACPKMQPARLVNREARGRAGGQALLPKPLKSAPSQPVGSPTPRGVVGVLSATPSPCQRAWWVSRRTRALRKQFSGQECPPRRATAWWLGGWRTPPPGGMVQGAGAQRGYPICTFGSFYHFVNWAPLQAKFTNSVRPVPSNHHGKNF